MVVTKLVGVSKNRTKVYIDDVFYFALYPRELTRYKITQDCEISAEQVEDLLVNVILKRAKSKALTLLKQKDQTEAEIRTKLKRCFYCERIIDQVVTYLYRYHYLDDLRYAQQYFAFKTGKMSYAQIRQKLLIKGISADIIEQVMSENIDEEQEQLLLEQLFQKKINNKDIAVFSSKDWARIYRFFITKGFASSDIKKLIRQYQENV